MYTFIKKGDVSWKLKSFFALLLAPMLLFGATNLNLSGFDIANCDAFIYEGPLYKWYYIGLAVLSMIWILFLVVKNYRIVAPEFKKQVVLMGLGIEFFLFTFFSLVILASYLTEFGFFQDSRLELFGLFGMAFFMIVIGFLIVKFKSFNIGMIAANALVIALLILVASQYTYVETATGVVLTSITLFLTAIVGWMLVKNVRKEIKQREEIEQLAGQLKKANARLKILDKMKSEFVSIASHQLRSPITSIRGYISMLLEGSYGKFPEKARDVLKNIFDSSKYMAMSIEDYLNVSRIEAGNMKYEYSEFSLKDEAEKISDELRQVAMKKGLVLVFRSDCNGSGMVKADVGKLRQVIMNLIDNSIKYTKKGTVTVVAHDDLKMKRMTISITDTGVGMNKDALEEVFDKFVRAKNANEINVTGTGLGLFVAKKMVIDMKGKVWAESDGEGKGSSFHIEFPMLKGKANPHK
jgi:signal transduction histidine kinase